MDIIEWAEWTIKWIKLALYLTGAAAGAVGLLSFIAPQRSIALYQWIMRQFNWRVEPLDYKKEIRHTKWLGALLAILAAVIFVLMV